MYWFVLESTYQHHGRRFRKPQVDGSNPSVGSIIPSACRLAPRGPRGGLFICMHLFDSNPLLNHCASSASISTIASRCMSGKTWL